MEVVSYQEILRELASAHSIATGYTGYGGHYVEASDDTLIKTLRAFGVDLGSQEAPSEEDLGRALQARRDQLFTRPLPPSIVATEGDAYVFNVHVHDGAPAELTIRLEDGSLAEPEQIDNWEPPREIDGATWGEASFRLPTDLPTGWHTLTLTSEDLTASSFLIVTPRRLSTTDKVLEHPVAGVMAQIYSVRSEKSWGMGDFHDLGDLAEVLAAEAGADFLLINPMHAAEPFPPVEDSPYLPTSRRFTNPIYIRIEDIPELLELPQEVQEEVEEIAAEFHALNHSADIIERNPIYEAKLQVLREIFNSGRDAAREQDFREFVSGEGQGLVDFATWCAQQEIAANREDTAHSIPDAEEDVAEFYMWLQWICDQQLAAAQARAVDAGMSIGIMADLAVGVHPGGADANTLTDVLAPAASVGAPPDNYNQQGQDWSQPPWHPERLAEQGYIPWRDLLRTVLRHSGGIRVDHVLGLFRLYWIPRMQSPTTGTYVNYDYNALVGILALEAERAGAVVIGEDLGTFEPWVQEVLASRGIMGTSILWFEHSPGGPGPRRQEEYRTAALSSVTTHDLPPTAGYLEGEHITLRDKLGILTNSVAEENAMDLQWQAEVLNRVKEQGGFEGTDFQMDDFAGRARQDRGATADLLAAMHRFIAHTPSALTCTSLVDMVADKRAQNQPGTVRSQYPNWCIPLCDDEGRSVLIEDLAGNELFHRIADASRRP